MHEDKRIFIIKRKIHCRIFCPPNGRRSTYFAGSAQFQTYWRSFRTRCKVRVFHKNIILTIIDKQTNEACNEVIDIPAHPISFEHNSELSALSWEAVDNRLSLEELTEKYRKIVSAPMIHPLFVLLLVGFANASFCKLFGGDLISMGIVFSATITGFYLKQQMQKKKINHYITFIVSAFRGFPMCIHSFDI